MQFDCKLQIAKIIILMYFLYILIKKECIGMGKIFLIALTYLKIIICEI